MAEDWTNWSGSATASPSVLHFARSIDDVAALVVDAAANGRTVRAVGSAHSHYPLVPTDGIIVDLSALVGVGPVNGTRAWVRAGTTIAALGPLLAGHGLALHNQGDIDRQAIAGAVATGTHGTGLGLRNLSAAVTAVRLVTATGEVVTVDADHPAFVAARLNLGALGVVVDVELETRPRYRLADRIELLDYDAVRRAAGTEPSLARHFEFFWFPEHDRAAAKWITGTDDSATYPIGAEGHRRGWSHEVLPSHRPDRHVEMEYAVPLDGSLDCLDEIRALIQSRFGELTWPIEYRTVAADEVALSQADGRDVATISLHQGIGLPAEPLFRAAEEIFARYDGRPHWGKVHYLDGDELARRHPRWNQWWAARNAMDPDGVFLNSTLEGWRAATSW